MSRSNIADDERRFVPPAAQWNVAAGIIAAISGIAVTTLAWLWLETSSPLVALACGAGTAGFCLWADRWRRRQTAPPALSVSRTGLVVEDGRERTAVAWAEVIEVRHVDRELETIEIVRRAGAGPIVVVIDHFNREQAEEIRRRLLSKAA